MYFAVALILVGVWLIVDAQEVPSEALTLGVGIAVVALAFLGSSLSDGLRRG